MYWELFELAMKDFEDACKDMREAPEKLRGNIRELRDYTNTESNAP